MGLKNDTVEFMAEWMPKLNRTFELEVLGLNKDKRGISASPCPTLLRAARELRTVILNGWKSYELEAAVKMMRGEAPFDGVELQ
jgi:hypothetical protein